MQKLSDAAAAVIALKWATRLVDLVGHYFDFPEVYTSLLPTMWVASNNDEDLRVDKDALA